MRPLSVIYMNTKIAIAVSLLAILSIGLVGQIFAQTRGPGVKAGDYFIYIASASWKSDNASAPVPAGLDLYNSTSQYKVQLSGVSGVNATATYLWDFTNGTELPYLLTQDVESGQSFYHSYNAPPLEVLVGANLNEGDSLHPTGNDTVTINQTITRAYAGGTRDINFIELVYPIQNNETDTTAVGSTTDRFYIDKATGVIVEQDAIIEHTANPSETLSVSWKLKETNLWDASPAFSFSLPIILAIVAVLIVAIILIAVYVLRRKGKGKKSRR